MTLSELKKAIQEWVQSSEPTFVKNLEIIIQNAEQELHDKVRIPSARVTTDLTTTNGVNTVDAPTGMGVPLGLFITSSGRPYPLVQRDPSFIREAYSGTVNSRPLDYAWLRSDTTKATILLGPTPNAAYTLTVEYYQTQPESIVTTPNGTWLSINFSDVLLKHCLPQAAIFLKQWENVEVYKKEAADALQQMGQFNLAGRKDEWKA